MSNKKEENLEEVKKVKEVSETKTTETKAKTKKASENKVEKKFRCLRDTRAVDINHN